MTVDKAVQVIQKVIANEIEEYNQSPSSQGKDNDGNPIRIPHPLDIVDRDDILFEMSMEINDVALASTPVSLIESSGSTAPELKRLSGDYYIRVPAEPQLGQPLDIDDGLAYAVVYGTLGRIWDGFSDYQQNGSVIVSTYNQAYRKYIKDLLAGTVSGGAETYVRFSADGTTWHDSYQSGDLYISFKKIDTDTWTQPARFVGEQGPQGEPGTPCSDTQFIALQDTPADYSGNGGKFVAVKSGEDGVEFVDPPSGDGGGASAFTDLSDTPSDYTGAGGKAVTVKSDGSGLEFSETVKKFTDLSDTPASLTADKWVKVNAAGDALELTDAPSGGGTVTQFGDKPFFSDANGSTITLDCRVNNIFHLYQLSDTLTVSFQHFDDSNNGGNDNASAPWGTTYTFVLVSSGSANIVFDSNETIMGDASCEPGSNSPNTSISATILKMYYDGFTWLVVSRTVIHDYPG